MADTHTTFYTVSVNELETWKVESHTAKTWKVARELSHGYTARRTVRLADIGQTFHVTARAALSARAADLADDIKHLIEQTHRKRTQLGMVESEMRRLDKAQTVGAVDPVSQATTA